MSLQTLPFFSFLLFLVILLLFFSLSRICDANENFLSLFLIPTTNKNSTSLTQIKHFQPHTEAGKSFIVMDFELVRKIVAMLFSSHDIRLTYFTIGKPVSVQSAEKKEEKSRKEKKITVLQFRPLLFFPRFYFHLPADMRNWKSRSFADVVAVSPAGLKSGAGQDSRLIKNFFIFSPAHFSLHRRRRSSAARVRQEEKLLFQKLTRARRQEFSKI